MATAKIGINGFGRIGRLILREAASRKDVEVVAVNDPFIDVTYAKYMLQYDSIHGRFKGDLRVDGNALVVNGKKVQFFAEKDPTLIPWGNVGADIIADKVLESIKELGIPHKKSDIADHVTVSIGATTVVPSRGHEYMDYIKCADKALYMSKQGGRNRYTHLEYGQAEQ